MHDPQSTTVTVIDLGYETRDRSGDDLARVSSLAAREATQAPPQGFSPKIGALACLSLGLLIYANSFSGTFVFDDWIHVLAKEHQRLLSSPWELLTESSRPLATLSFALNYVLHGHRPWGYHLVNLGIHLAATLVLFGIVRRTLSRGRLAQRYRNSADGLALAVALIWMAHPLQTQSVTYIVQRMESLMGMLYLATLYGFIRAQDSPRPRWWYTASVACCALGMAAKEVMVTAPLVVLWYDRAMVASSWREIVRRRSRYYAALGATWGALAALLVTHGTGYMNSGVMVVRGVTPLEYALTQPSIILHYLRLTFWPAGQCLDSSWPPARSVWQIVPPAAVILALLAATAWCIVRRPNWGFLGGWFFLILAPTSSVVPIRDLAFEHRMYLSLAAVATAAVIVGYELLERLLAKLSMRRDARRAIETAVVVAVVAALGYTTHVRNRVYATEATVWRDVVAQAPYNPRGHNNLGFALFREGRLHEAGREYREALRRFPAYFQARVNLGILLMNQRDFDGAAAQLREAIRLDPQSAWARINLAHVLAQQGKAGEAREHLQQALRRNPAYRPEAEANRYLRPLLKTAPHGR